MADCDCGCGGYNHEGGEAGVLAGNGCKGDPAGDPEGALGLAREQVSRALLQTALKLLGRRSQRFWLIVHLSRRWCSSSSSNSSGDRSRGA